MSQLALQSTTIRVPLKLFSATDHITAQTGKTVVITISKNGGAFGNPNAGATNATEIASGWYYVDLDTTDTATLGPLIVRGTNTGSDDVEAVFRVRKATNLDMTGVPNAAAGASGGLLLGTSAIFEGGAYTITQYIEIIGSSVAGKASGGPGSPVFRDLQDSRNVITGTADSSGNRTAATYNPA